MTMIQTMPMKKWVAEVAKRRDQQNWYALHTKPLHERKVAEQLQAWWQLEAWCPVRKEVRDGSRGKKKVEIPLFSSYVLVHVTEKDRIQALQHPAVTHCVTYLHRPAIIRDQEIEGLKAFINQYTDIKTQPLTPGKTATLIGGPFAGQQGVVHDRNSNKVTLILQDLCFLVEAPITDVSAAV